MFDELPELSGVEPSGWLVTPSLRDDDVHVLPIEDAAEHFESVDCPCQPGVESHRGPTGEVRRLVVHNPFDGREFIEQTVVIAEGMIRS